MTNKTAMIDVGGGFRAIFGAGVMDRMMEDDISVDHCYGVSAGSANMVSFIAGQHGRNHKFTRSMRSVRNMPASTVTSEITISPT